MASISKLNCWWFASDPSMKFYQNLQNGCKSFICWKRWRPIRANPPLHWTKYTCKLNKRKKQGNLRTKGKSPEKKDCSSFGFCLNYRPPPLSPKFGQLVQLFSDVEIQDLEVRLKILYILHNLLYTYNLMKQIKVQIVGALEDIDSSYGPKMH